MSDDFRRVAEDATAALYSEECMTISQFAAGADENEHFHEGSNALRARLDALIEPARETEEEEEELPNWPEGSQYSYFNDMVPVRRP